MPPGIWKPCEMVFATTRTKAPLVAAYSSTDVEFCEAT